MTVQTRQLSLTLVGPGRAGKAFARSWMDAGGRIAEVVSPTKAAAAAAARELGAGDPAGIALAVASGDILVVAVPDDAIAAAARSLAGRTSCRAVFHLSGALPAERLEALGGSGAALGSLHPLRVFSGRPGENWRGAFVAIEGDERAVALGEGIVRDIGARGRRIRAADKPLYHAAAALAAGGTVSLVALAARVWEKVGIPPEESREALAGLAAEAAAAAAAQPFEVALTGPVARRDLATVRAHCEVLAEDPDLMRVYGLLAEETLRRTPGRGREEEIRALLHRGC